MSNGDPIIIKGGGSIEIMLSKDSFPGDAANADRHYSSDRHITRVTITDEASGIETALPIPPHGKFRISIFHSK